MFLTEWSWIYFSPQEVLSPDGLRLWDYRGELKMNPGFLDRCDAFREWLGYPLLANHQGLMYRGYRSPEENIGIGGAIQSPHVQGIAIDFSSREMGVEELASAAIDFGFTGVGLYASWVHVDDRAVIGNEPVVWDKR